MSSYSFSNQFYQHWTCAPDPVRAAIVQELTDITRLLQTDTPFESFVFSTHDLDSYLDDLYATHEQQQAAAKEAAEKQSQQIAEQQQLEAQQKKAEEDAIEAARQQEAAQKLQDEAATLAAEKNHLAANMNTNSIDTDNKNDSSDHQNSTDAVSDKVNKDNIDTVNRAKVTANSTSTINAIPDKLDNHAAINLSLKDTELNATHKTLIHELEMNIDDYLSEQMMQMSENLKSWLRAEVSRQLAAKEQSLDSTDEK